MLKNLKKCRAQLYARGDLSEAKEYNFFPVSFEMPKVTCTHAKIAFSVVSVGDIERATASVVVQGR